MKQKFILKTVFKEFIGELVGTAIMVFYGLCGSAFNTLNGNDSPYTGPIAFGFGVIFAMLVAGQISGGHVNPAFSIATAVIGQLLPCWRLLYYLLAQFSGAFLGSVLAYLLYRPSILAMEDRHYSISNNHTKVSNLLPTTSIFVTAPSATTTLSVAIADQVLITAVVVMVVLFTTDERCHRTPFVLQALVVGLTMVSMNLCMGFNANAIFNPARDLGPRLMLSLFGYGDIVWSPLDGHFWWAVGLLAPSLGGVIGGLSYHFLAKLRTFPAYFKRDTVSDTFSIPSIEDNKYSFDKTSF